MRENLFANRKSTQIAANAWFRANQQPYQLNQWDTQSQANELKDKSGESFWQMALVRVI